MSDGKVTTARAVEPSMEEILASIRRIISDEPAPGVAAASPAAEAAPAVTAQEPALTPAKPVLREIARPLRAPERIVSREPDARPALQPIEPSPMLRAEKPLISPGPSAAASESFGRVPQPAPVRPAGERSLEDVVRDLLRPMLKTWLDDHLPDLVERLVQREIERVSRG